MNALSEAVERRVRNQRRSPYSKEASAAELHDEKPM